ncbi:MAG: hypothetical protein AABX02_02565 [archaeon]|mgnify:CR=1 FL=1
MAVEFLDSISRFIFSFSLSNALEWTAYALALAGYIILIWHFYHFIARRDIFKRHLSFSHPGVVGAVEDLVLFFLRIVKYGILFPLASFLWFGAFAMLLFVVAQNQNMPQIVWVAIGLVSATRILAYYNEGAAQELSKTLPIVILGVALVEPDFFKFDLVQERLSQLPALTELLVHFILYLIFLELSLRILLHIKQSLAGKNPAEIK